MSEQTHKVCNECKKNKEVLLFYKRSSSHTKKSNKVRYRSQCIECTLLYVRRDTGRYSSYMESAKRKGREFSLTKDDFCSFKKECFYCGSKMLQVRLDRIDNDIGYTKDNVRSCCKKCNYFKFTLTKEEFLLHVKKIFLYQKRKGEFKDAK